jgi:hypothetical protein
LISVYLNDNLFRGEQINNSIRSRYREFATNSKYDNQR